MSEITFKEVEVQKLNLQPGEVLVVSVKSNEINEEGLSHLGTGLRNIFPNNKVVVLAVEPEGSIDLTIAIQAEYPQTNYCTDCNCGKKTAYEGE